MPNIVPQNNHETLITLENIRDWLWAKGREIYVKSYGTKDVIKNYRDYLQKMTIQNRTDYWMEIYKEIEHVEFARKMKNDPGLFPLMEALLQRQFKN